MRTLGVVSASTIAIPTNARWIDAGSHESDETLDQIPSNIVGADPIGGLVVSGGTQDFELTLVPKNSWEFTESLNR